MPTKLTHDFIEFDIEYLPSCKDCEISIDYDNDLYDTLHIDYEKKIALCKDCCKLEHFFVDKSDIKYESIYGFGNIFNDIKTINECSKCNFVFDESIYVDDCIDELLCIGCSRNEKPDCKNILVRLYNGYSEYIDPLIECYNCGLNFVEKYKDIKKEQIQTIKCTEIKY